MFRLLILVALICLVVEKRQKLQSFLFRGILLKVKCFVSIDRISGLTACQSD